MTKDTEIEAAIFRRLVDHLRKETDLQNIDLMNLAGFCRNCLSKWYVEEASTLGHPIDEEDARAKIYGMNYGEWKKKYQKPATQEQLDAMQDKQKK
jgi:hypothetical protein|tara:strand:- start:380 stop:667 length:288 start_codon:yes stop_codon:yes gene_type:complete